MWINTELSTVPHPYPSEIIKEDSTFLKYYPQNVHKSDIHVDNPVDECE
jgi:hypothetical protein